MGSIKDILREMIAEQAHTSWAGWIHYQLQVKGQQNEDGSITIPKEYVNRWIIQMVTPYKDLTEEEKKSDRVEADSYIGIIEKWLKMIGSKEEK
jgi:hypothetical protein